MSPRAKGNGIERFAIAGVAGLLALLWVVGERTSNFSAAAGDSFAIPLAGGWAFILLILTIIGVNAMLVAAETAIDLLMPMHVKHAPDERASRRLQVLLEHQQKYIAACSLGSHAARLVLIFLGLLLAQDLAKLLAEEFGWQLNYGTVLIAAGIIAIPLVLVNLILGELVPKSFASMHPQSVARRLYAFARVTSMLFSIPAGLVVALANLLTARFGGRASFTVPNQTEEQIKSLVDTAQESGEIEDDEKELLHSVFEFADTVVREVMTPRVDLEAMPIQSDPHEIVRIIAETGHSRIPLYEETDDQIVGVIHAKDLLLSMVDGKPVDLRMLMRPALFLPENMNLQEALTEMRLSRAQLAIVQDEFGGTAGIVTTEDIVEELVGEIVDEYDIEEPLVVQTENGFLVDGKTHVDDVNAEIGSHFESPEFDTIGGFVFGLFGRQPKEGDSIEHAGYVFRVAETDGRRIQKLAVEPLETSSLDG